MLTSSDKLVTVCVEDVSKRYQLRAGQDSLRSLFSAWGSRLLGRTRSGSDEEGNLFWALKGVDFEVRQGETLGLVGPNGAGKTTILKLLSRVTRPTFGEVMVKGRFSSLIELGAGFHPDLTGRENIYLNGVILGLTSQQVKERFNDIVAFSELDRFIDMPVKRYSSGMYARLGFAVAAHVDPDVMLVDEVLAVGDASFQQKCYDFIHNFVKRGKTTVFVSHNLVVIEQLCDRVIWLERGQIVNEGDPKTVLSAYLDSQEQRMLASTSGFETVDGRLKIVGVSFVDGNGNERDTFTSGDDIVVQIKYQAQPAIERPHFVVAVADAQGGPPLFLASMLVDGDVPPCITGEGVLRCRFESVPLKPRTYQVIGEVWGADQARLLMKWQRIGSFRVVDASYRQTREVGKGGLRHLRIDAPIDLPYKWEY